MNKAPPLLTLNDGLLTFGGLTIFQDLSLSLFPRDRACLVGRNGCGKSTLLKVISGLIELDKGERFVKPHLKVALLGQSLAPSKPISILQYLQDEVGPRVEGYVLEETLQHLELEPTRKLEDLSGGESRRVMLAKALVEKPDILLLDEPTNHLDLATIEWLENFLTSYPGAILMVSHDRAFLSKLSRRTFWLDRGQLRILEKGYPFFDDWAETILNHESRTQEKLSQKIAQETDWLHRGVTARRKRNQGRLRQLMDLREQKRQHQGPQGSIVVAAQEASLGSRLVFEAKNVCKSFTDKALIKDFSCRILRGERIGIIGSNGAGKSTLLKLFTGKIVPDSGHIRRAKNLEIALFDQTQASLDLELNPWQTLCEHGGDQVMVQGESRHVMGYLQSFLFDRKQALTPLRNLSGGERNRLLLAKILAKQSDLLILDEPTNDLDMDTLDLLQEYLTDYPGTLLLVSHDRDFLDRTTTNILALEGEGHVQMYIGGYTDYAAHRPSPPPTLIKERKVILPAAPKAKHKLSYKEARDLDILPQTIETLTQTIQGLEDRLSEPTLYQKDPATFDTLTRQLQEARHQLDTQEERLIHLLIQEEELEGRTP